MTSKTKTLPYIQKVPWNPIASRKNGNVLVAPNMLTAVHKPHRPAACDLENKPEIIFTKYTLYYTLIRECPKTGGETAL